MSGKMFRGTFSVTNVLGTPPNPDNRCHIPATKSPVVLEGSRTAGLAESEAEKRDLRGRPRTL
jgi:hypothetical protein